MLGKSRENSIDTSREQKPGLTVSDLLVPIMSIVIFLLMVNFVYVPMLAESANMNQEIAETKDKQQQLVKLIEAAKALNSNDLSTDYNMMTKIVPNRLEVANFAYYIDDLAIKEGLVLNQITASNSKTQTTKAGTDDNSAYAVNGPLKYEGSYTSIVSFLNQLQQSSPYIITADNVALSKNSSDPTKTKWSLELVVSGYYMSPQESVTVNLYNPFAPYTARKDLLEALRERAQKLTTLPSQN